MVCSSPRPGPRRGTGFKSVTLEHEMTHRPDFRATILCPLQFEREHLIGGSLEDCEIVCIGPGQAGVDRWIHQRKSGTDRPIILAGLAGALTPAIAAGSAWVVTRVTTPHRKQEWRPNWFPHADALSRVSCAITSADATVVAPDAKRRLHECTCADLVDLESAAFARAASSENWRWAIVRGVSDNAAATLPANIDQWVDADGYTRTRAAVTGLMREPWTLPQVLRLRSDGIAALRGVAKLIAALLSEGPPNA
jgi:hypothetical protein